MVCVSVENVNVFATGALRLREQIICVTVYGQFREGLETQALRFWVGLLLVVISVCDLGCHPPRQILLLSIQVLQLKKYIYFWELDPRTLFLTAPLLMWDPCWFQPIYKEVLSVNEIISLLLQSLASLSPVYTAS